MKAPEKIYVIEQEAARVIECANAVVEQLKEEMI